MWTKNDADSRAGGEGLALAQGWFEFPTAHARDRRTVQSGLAGGLADAGISDAPRGIDLDQHSDGAADGAFLQEGRINGICFGNADRPAGGSGGDAGTGVSGGV